MRGWAGLLVITAALGVGACAIAPPPEVALQDRCTFRRLLLNVPLPGERSASERNELAADLAEVYAGPAPPGVSNSLLFLSGGSQEGAFGAGFLDGWSRRRTQEVAQRAAHNLPPARGLPSFRVVTGISTGAILATWAFINRTDQLPPRYRIRRERDVLRPYSDATSELSVGGAIARHGAVGDLSPLRRLLEQNLTEAVMRQVAEEGAESRRRLYVGAVDVDSGQAIAFDLTDMAARSVANPQRYTFYRDCYISAIIASSSVPLAAPPTFIDNRMYIDGGARFGVFSETIATVIDPGRSFAGGGGPPNYYVLANRTLRVEPQCSKVHEADCRPPPDDLDGPLRSWRFQDLARRSADILIDQTYRSSIERILQEAASNQGSAWLEFIHPDAMTYQAEMPIPELGTGSKQCAEWRVIDEQRDHPLEFHPRYMNCLISYGDWLAGQSEWHLKE